jgi:hypothetical protein
MGHLPCFCVEWPAYDILLMQRVDNSYFSKVRKEADCNESAERISTEMNMGYY